MKDLPAFIHFQIPELATFKYFFWMKSILQIESMRGVKFSFDDDRYKEFHSISDNIFTLYNRMPMTEIWNIESINSTLRQINFYYESGSFLNKGDVQILYQKLTELLNHVEKQAETGKKFRIGTKPSDDDPQYRMFINELILGDNTYLVELEDIRLTFLNHSVLYFIATRDERFNRSMFNNLKNLVQKSTLISEVGEKERTKFFNRLRYKIQERVAALA
jgi:hypothetical protein